MPTMFVNCENLNLRSAPAVAPGNIAGKLDLNQQVEVTGEADTNGWIAASATIDGSARRGFVAAKFLREPVGPAVEALMAAARREWRRFDQGRGEEHLDPFFRFVGEMWQAIGEDLDGRDRQVPWSAAAISFMVRRAGEGHAAYRSFKFAQAHSTFTHDAIRRRRANDANAPFWGFRRGERAPQLGDIVVKPRAGSGATFELAERTGQFASHSDIVVAIDSPGFRILTIGGNVGHSVDITIYPLGPDDFLTSGSGVFAVLANRTDAM
jgi:hypothetical protein